MKQERLYKVLLAPHMSEKAAKATEQNNEYVFKVVKDATKTEVKDAVELLFKAKVVTVRMMNVKPKHKRFGKIEGMRKGWKKAYVTLQAGQAIDLANA